MLYVDTILPLPLNATFTYIVPDEMADAVNVGCRVLVPFGRNKQYTGIVVSVSPLRPDVSFELKKITMVLDSTPVIRSPQLRLWQWISDYYMSSVGDVYKAAVPAGLKVEGETVVMINPDMAPEERDDLDERQLMVCMTLEHEGPQTVAALQRALKYTHMEALLASLLDSRHVLISERLSERYRPKTETCVRFAPAMHADGTLTAAFEAVKGRPKRETLVLALAEMSGMARAGSEPRQVKRSDLLDRSGVSAAVLAALVKAGVVEIYKKEVRRFVFTGTVDPTLPTLSPTQVEARDAIHRSFTDKRVTLLHGVTGSGKTEIYIHLIDHVLRQGRQALFLVPEIALTTQLTQRLQRVFGDKVVIYHSRFSDAERVDIWRDMLARPAEPRVVIGARSAVFLPFSSLGLIVVDEEHETSYKQYDPAPRYNARDVAIVLAGMHDAHVLLGSATPSVETYYKAESGKFGLVSLTERFDGATLPSVQLVNLKQEYSRKAVHGAFADVVTADIRNTLSHDRQAIIFHNRRGYSPYARCKACAHIPKCQYCDVSLTYHRGIDRLVCHYCGAEYVKPAKCPVCNEPAIEISGFGTERLEDDMKLLFPNARMLRMDLDTTRAKDAYSHIIDEFSARKADLLVGTQMVTKGLDFDGVDTVAVLRADGLVNFPDFRSGERAFSMLEQVAGRAGRRSNNGKVLIQTFNPALPIYKEVQEHNYEKFYRREIEQRKQFLYPPFTRVVYIYLKHRSEETINPAAEEYAQMLKRVFGSRILGPDKPLVGRIQSLHIRRIMLKVEVTASMKRVKELLLQAHSDFVNAAPGRSSLIVYYDVDPY